MQVHVSSEQIIRRTSTLIPAPHVRLHRESVVTLVYAASISMRDVILLTWYVVADERPLYVRGRQDLLQGGHFQPTIMPS